MTKCEPNVLELIDLIYAAGLEPSEWPNVADGLGRAFPFAATALQVVNTTHKYGTSFSLANWQDGAMENYARYFIQRSPWVRAHQEAKLGVPYHAADVCPSSTFSDTEFYHDWIRPNKIGCGATAVKLLDDGNRFVTLSMNYEERLFDDIKEPVTQLFSVLIPHLNRAIEMNRRLSGNDTLARTVDGLLHTIARPVFLLSPDCRAIHMNPRAELSVRRKQGIYVGRGGHLHLDDISETATLHRLVAETANRDEASSCSEYGLLKFGAPAVGGPNLIFVFPLISSASHSFLQPLQQPDPQVLATVYFRQDATVSDANRLAAAFGFTPAESRVVEALAAGQTLADYAEKTSRSIHTVRLQLKNSLAKADCRTQSDLMRVVLRMVPAPN